MSLTSTQSLVSPVLLARGFGQGPDFKVCTKAAEADTSLDLPIIRMTGSSTVKDLQGDIMTITALQDMANGDPELTIFIDHNYSLPNDVFGKLYGKPEIRMLGHIADLHLAAVADLSRDEPGLPHSKALDIYTQIKKGKIRHGSSVGCQVTQYQFLDPDDFFSGLLIEHVIWVEHSIVGIPASQRSWVEQAVKGVFERKLVEGDADAARQLAPAMKSMYWRDYDSLLGYLKSEGLRKDFECVRERGAASQRIMFDFKNDAFYLDERNGARKSLSREETTDLLEKELPQPEMDTLEDDDDEHVMDATKTVCGKTSWPLMAIGTEWTGSKAESAVFAYAGGDDFSPAKAKHGFLYQDASKDPKTKGAYKMPFCYGSDGGLKIVPLGVRACCNVLSGGRGGGNFDGDEAGMKAKCKTMYGRINSEFKPDPEWVVPWEKEDKSLATLYEDELAFMQMLGFEVVEQDGMFSIKNADGECIPWLSKATAEVLDTTAGDELVRQDLGEETKAVSVSADGSHEPFTGTHTHSHKTYGSQGSDDMHEHEHSHDGDAHHGHPHAEKSAEPEKQADAQVTGGEETSAATHMDVTPAPSPDPVQLAYLAMYNDLGKKLGFPEHTLMTKCDLVPTEGDAGIVRSTLSALDDCSDAMMELAQRTDGYVDALMGMMGVPDTNDMDEGSASSSMSILYNHTPGTTKEGRTLSGKNVGIVQQIHDLAAAMHPDCCKGNQQESGDIPPPASVTVEDLQDEARQMTGDPFVSLSSFVGDALKSTLTKTLEGISAKAIIEQAVEQAVDGALHEARKSIDLLQREQMTLMTHLSKLANMPLPRPTQLTRTVKPTSVHALSNVATYEDLLEVAGASPADTLAEVLTQTRIVEVPITRDGREVRTKMRCWPAGVGVSVRPALSNEQKMLMHYREWDAYYSGERDVLVPAAIDDPAESFV